MGARSWQILLQQNTQSKDRVFFTSKKERAAVCQMLTGDISMQDFCEVSEITSDNGRLIMDMVRHILQTFHNEMPSSYKHFIANVCKPTSVRGLVQVLTPEPLEFLEQFCKRQLNIRSHMSQRQLKCLVTSLPAVWPHLDGICVLQNSEYLPQEVSNIVLRLLDIRY